MSDTLVRERSEPIAPRTPLLSCRGIDMAYGPVQILFDGLRRISLVYWMGSSADRGPGHGHAPAEVSAI